jgi:uncharacterized membrane protein (DUF373 family)
MAEIIKCIFLVFVIVSTFRNVVKTLRNKVITNFEIWVMAISIVGFIYLQWWR